MRIAFADYSGWDFHAQSVDMMPMGGAQSAACYLARALARAGHEVFLLNHGTSPGQYDGVSCLSWSQLSVEAFRALQLDAVIDLLSVEEGERLRAAAGPRPLLILWNQHSENQPAVQPLADARIRDLFDGFAMVSDWQSEQFHRRFGLDRSRMTVLRNAIAPAFAHLFSERELILGQKAMPPTLAYTSTPFRGLNLLLDAFGPIRHAVPEARLRVYSSMKVYQHSAVEDDTAHGHLYRRCREMGGVEYIGSLPQPELARALRSTMVLAYPNTFPETSCISVMEAMAAGCRVVTTELGALPETASGFARLISIGRDYLPQFIDQTAQALRRCAARDPVTELELRRQVAVMNQTAVWSARASEWIRWLESLARPPAARGAAIAPREVAP